MDIVIFGQTINSFCGDIGFKIDGEVAFENIVLKDSSVTLPSKEEFEARYQSFKSQAKIDEALDALNMKRDKELQGFVIDNIFINEDIIKTMAVQFNIADDTEMIQWIDINNQVVEFGKADFGALIKQGSMKIKEIYFKYRQLKDEIVAQK